MTNDLSKVPRVNSANHASSANNTNGTNHASSANNANASNTNSSTSAVNQSDPLIGFYFTALYGHHEEALPIDFPDFFPEENKPAFFAILDTLSPTERTILVAHYGLGKEPQKPLSEIGRTLARPMPKKQVARTLKSATKKLRKRFMRQLEILLHTREFYKLKLEKLQSVQAYLELRLCSSYSFQEFLHAVSYAKLFLTQAETLNLAKELVMGSRHIDDYEANLAILANPTNQLRVVSNPPRNLVEEARMSLNSLLKAVRWIELHRDLMDDSYYDIEMTPYRDGVQSLGLSVRITNALRRAGILTIGNLASTTIAELKSTKGFGSKSIQEVIVACHQIGIELKTK